MPNFPGFQLTADGQRLFAKMQTGTPLIFTKVSVGSGSMPPDNNPFSALAAADVVTIYYGEQGVVAAPADGGTGFGLEVSKAGVVGVAQELELTCLQAAGLVGGEYVTLALPQLNFYIWFRVAGGGVDPRPAGAVGIVIDLVAADSAISVASKTAMAIDQHRLTLTDLRGLIDAKMDLAIASIDVPGDGTTHLNALLSNAALAQGFDWRETGIFATDPDNGEILYAVTLTANGDPIPAMGGATVVESEITAITKIGAASDVQTVAVTGSAIVSQDTLNHRPQKLAVLAVATGNIVLSGGQTIDGVALVAGNRVLVAGQTDAGENGIYVVSTEGWSRATDADTASKITGAIVPVAQGTAHADSVWVLTTDAPIVLGTTGLSLSKQSEVGVPDKIAHLISQVGTLAKADKTQLLTALQALFYHNDNIIGTVSEAAGVPTGAIIERGHNANGDYVKFADGTVICTLETSLSAVNDDSQSIQGIVWYRNTYIWTFPVEFAVPPETVGGSVRQNSSVCAVFCNSNAVTTTTAGIDTVSAMSFVAFALLKRRLFAIGRWF